MPAAVFTKQRTANYSSGTGKLFSFVPSSSYPATGEPIAKTDCGLNNDIDMIVCGPAVDASGNALLVAFNPVTSRLRFFYPTGGASAAPAAVAQPLAAAPTIGASTATPASGATAMTSTAAQPAVPVTFGTIAAGAFTPGAGKEVATATDLSGYTVYGLAFGNN